MLKHRVISAICMLAVFLWGLFAWPYQYFALFLLLLVALGGWEWARLGGLRSSVHRGGYAIVTAAIATPLVLPELAALPAVYLLAPAALFWLGAAIVLLRDKVPEPLRDDASTWRLAIAPPLLALVLWSMLWLRDSSIGSPWLFLYVFCAIWLADIAAYFVGRKWGRHKLAPNTSPGKTREGFYGGMLAVGLWAVLALLTKPFEISASVLLVATLLAGFFAVIGDLFESYLKRSAGVKDSGRLLPGHGGVLDRIDSALAAIPVFVFIVAIGV
ncbi:MAG: phosphatidate cytidylyltransferase [Pseudomonadota bacterium]